MHGIEPGCDQHVETVFVHQHNCPLQKLVLVNFNTFIPTWLFMVLVLSFSQVLHCNWGQDSNTTVTKSFQYFGKIMLLVDQEINICLAKGECKPYGTITSLNLLKPNISTLIQSVLTQFWGYLSFGSSFKVTG